MAEKNLNQITKISTNKAVMEVLDDGFDKERVVFNFQEYDGAKNRIRISLTYQEFDKLYNGVLNGSILWLVKQPNPQNPNYPSKVDIHMGGWERDGGVFANGLHIEAGKSDKEERFYIVAEEGPGQKQPRTGGFYLDRSNRNAIKAIGIPVSVSDMLVLVTTTYRRITAHAVLRNRYMAHELSKVYDLLKVIATQVGVAPDAVNAILNKEMEKPWANNTNGGNTRHNNQQQNRGGYNNTGNGGYGNSGGYGNGGGYSQQYHPSDEFMNIPDGLDIDLPFN